MNQNESKKTKSLIEAGGDIAGSAIGGAIGFFATGPLGAAAGAALGSTLSRTLEKIGADFYERFLSPREKIRCGASLAFIAKKLDEKFKAGAKLREDIFEKKENARPNADEILEGVILKAQREHQEKKIKYYSNIFTNYAIYADINSSEANQILLIAEKFSYRQLCLIALFAKSPDNDILDKEFPLEKRKSFRRVSILQDIFDLYNSGILYCSPPEESKSNTARALLDLFGIVPKYMYLRQLGQVLYRMMELQEIPGSDLEPIIEELK